MLVKNFSRHPFNPDQLKALQLVAEALKLALMPGEHETPFFANADHFIKMIGGQIASAVVPGDILRDCWSQTPAGNPKDTLPGGIPEGTILIGWRTDKAARTRKRFAIRGITVHRWNRVVFPVTPTAKGAMIIPQLIFEAIISPTIENNFSDGKEFPYQEKDA
jgi:hypothetical protein